MAVTFAFIQSAPLFFTLFAVGEFALFSIQAPINAVSLWSVPTAVRPLAMSLGIVAVHVLGDVPSPPIVGAVQTAIDNWRCVVEEELLCSCVYMQICYRTHYICV